MKLTMYQIDAFADMVFTGNPAAVCPLSAWLPDALLLSIAEENNLAETAYFVPVRGGFHLRWFTPLAEMDLCGHATLASAYVLFHHLAYSEPVIHFHTRSGELIVRRDQDGEALRMTFPATTPQPCETPAALTAGLGRAPLTTLSAFDYIAVYPAEEDICAIVPDPAQLITLGLRGVIATAPGSNGIDFVSRFFAPEFGIYEDPVTGSAHCELAPYWAARLGRTRLHARQLSRRGGAITCELLGDKVELTGRAAHYMTAEITIPDAPVA